MVFFNSQLAFKILPFVNLSVKDVDRYIVNFQTWQKINSSWYDRPKFNSIEIVKGQELWSLSKKDEVGNFVTVIRDPKKEAGNSLVVFEMGDRNSESDHSIFNQEKSLAFMKLEADYLRHVKQQEIQIDASIGIDAVIVWQMSKRNSVKHGFISFFGLKVLSNQLDLTDSQ